MISLRAGLLCRTGSTGMRGLQVREKPCGLQPAGGLGPLRIVQGTVNQRCMLSVVLISYLSIFFSVELLPTWFITHDAQAESGVRVMFPLAVYPPTRGIPY